MTAIKQFFRQTFGNLAQTRPATAIARVLGEFLRLQFGTRDAWPLLIIVVVFVFLSWFVDATYEALFNDLLAALPKALVAAAFGLLLFAAVGIVLHLNLDPYVDISQQSPPRQRKVLILFLSLPKLDHVDDPKSDKSWLATCADVRDVSLREADTLAKFQGPWRMPMEAIARHLDTLERIAVILSADDTRSDGQQQASSSAAYFKLFCQVVHQMWPKDMSCPPITASVPAGVDFYDPRAIQRAINGSLPLARGSRQDHYRPDDIIIDVTGGTKPCTITGVMAGLSYKLGVEYCHRSGEVYSASEYRLNYTPGDNA